MIIGRMFGDPGPCPVDDAPHHTCVGPTPDIAVVQLPARDRVRTPRSASTLPEGAVPGAFTTATYRRAIDHPERQKGRR